MGEKREPGEIEAAEVVLPCAELEPTLAFFTERLGFRVALVYPAEAPAVAVIAGHGLRLRLDPGATGGPGSLRLLCRDPAAIAGWFREERLAPIPSLRAPSIKLRMGITIRNTTYPNTSAINSQPVHFLLTLSVHVAREFSTF